MSKSKAQNFINTMLRACNYFTNRLEEIDEELRLVQLELNDIEHYITLSKATQKQKLKELKRLEEIGKIRYGLKREREEIINISRKVKEGKFIFNNNTLKQYKENIVSTNQRWDNKQYTPRIREDLAF